MRDSNTHKLDKLWKHGLPDNLPPCFQEIKTAIDSALSGNFRAIHDITGRIAGNSSDFESYGTAFVRKADGEWAITNRILQTWSTIDFFGGRDYFPREWEMIGSQIRHALKDAHRWQTLQRYKNNGGIKEEHRKLLARLLWDMDPFRNDWVSLFVQGKRPFGNSGIEIDMIEILGWEFPPEDEDIPDEMIERVWQLFDELQFAIIDVLSIPAEPTHV